MMSSDHTYYNNLPIDDQDNKFSGELGEVQDVIVELESILNIPLLDDKIISSHNDVQNTFKNLSVRIKNITDKLNENKPEKLSKPIKPSEPEARHTRAETMSGYSSSDYEAPMVEFEYDNPNYDKELKTFDVVLLRYEEELKAFHSSQDALAKWGEEKIGGKETRNELIDIVAEISKELNTIKRNTQQLYSYDSISKELFVMLDKTKSAKTDSIQSIKNKISTEIKDADSEAVKIKKMAEILLQEYKVIFNSWGGENSQLGSDLHSFLSEKLYITSLPYIKEDVLKFNLDVPTALELSLNKDANKDLIKFYAVTRQYKAYENNLLVKADIGTQKTFAASVLKTTQDINLWNTHNPTIFSSSIPDGVGEMKKILIQYEKNPTQALIEIQKIAKEKLATEKGSRTPKTTEFYQAVASLNSEKLEAFHSKLDLPVNKVNVTSDIRNTNL